MAANYFLFEGKKQTETNSKETVCRILKAAVKIQMIGRVCVTYS